MSGQPTDLRSLKALLRLLGEQAQGGRVYLSGGASAVWAGWRHRTVGVDLKLDREPRGVFEAIRRAKEALDLNVGLAAPDDIIPPLPGWRGRSPLIARQGTIEFLHYDFCAQALARIVRDHERDRSDVEAMHRGQWIEPEMLMRRFEAIEGDLLRHPSIRPAQVRARVGSTIARLTQNRMDSENPDAGAKRAMQSVPLDLPGAARVTAGIAALARGERTTEALLVSVARSRLRDLGLYIPSAADAIEEPDLSLYAAIRKAGGGYSQYLALRRRLVSFAEAAEGLQHTRTVERETGPRHPTV